MWREFTEFADELKKARQFGSMTSFGRGLPRGGELSAIKSLERQEEILRALHRCGPMVSCQINSWGPAIWDKYNITASLYRWLWMSSVKAPRVTCTYSLQKMFS